MQIGTIRIHAYYFNSTQGGKTLKTEVKISACGKNSHSKAQNLFKHQFLALLLRQFGKNQASNLLSSRSLHYSA